ncbi:glycerate kinase [Jiulongibacter sediminis]|uniref:Glycerate kinase n=1 Tax=Jiulongibacter sediminis TaxID=1605367 RepID=A0A0P7BZW2_9BACT|nr:glycerate kinase [Jiulongibacter sediminis]KPM47802.1 hypothetical protein AFM12_11120 [Jiulongibacter sediminis]TBX23986.1 hypothetical protein TK44_11125 [Jiulongibacter sediminis]
MKKILLAPDSFKGSLSAIQVCDALEKGIPEGIEIIKVPLADGGEGSLEAIQQSLEAEEVKQFLKDPFWRPTDGFYLKKEGTAFIEMAVASGLNLIKKNQRDPELATTYGTGQQLKHAMKNGCTKVYLFVGGSATNDAGLGIAYALGYRFLDESGEELLPSGEALSQMKSVTKPAELPDFELKVVCDVQNPLYGENGAAYVYAPQKGADEAMVKRLDEGLRNFAEVVKKDLNKVVAHIPGAGAAGGVPAGMIAFFNAEILPGVQTIMQILELEKQLKDVDLIITGEGKLDTQTLSGKLIAGIADLGKKHEIPVSAVCGKNELTTEQLKDLGIHKAVSLVNAETSVEEAIENAAELLAKRVEELL